MAINIPSVVKCIKKKTYNVTIPQPKRYLGYKKIHRKIGIVLSITFLKKDGKTMEDWFYKDLKVGNEPFIIDIPISGVDGNKEVLMTSPIKEKYIGEDIEWSFTVEVLNDGYPNA